MSFRNREQIINNGWTPELRKIRTDVLDILDSVLEAVDPYKAVRSRFKNDIIVFEEESIDISAFDNVYLVGFGKASVGMAQAVCDSVDVKEGVVVTNDPNNQVKNDNVVTIVGGHPLPDQGSIDGAEKILSVVKKCNDCDVLIVLISGGGSALLSKPRVGLEDLQSVTSLLLKCGADINEINTIRKHLSLVKGGQLAASSNSLVISFIISDIIGDPISFIASGPTYPDSTSFTDALRVLEKYDLWEKIPLSAKKVIDNGVKGIIPDTPNEDDVVFKNVFNFIVANNEIACKAAEKKARNLGYETMLLTTSLDGEAKEKGRFLVDKVLNYMNSKSRVFISGGETTVTIHGDGKGGRNQEMILGSVRDLFEKDVVFASFATDGVDGMSDAAGAIADGFTLSRALSKGLDPDVFLRNNNSYEFFKNLDDLFMTGPTGTNVMDVQIVIRKGYGNKDILEKLSSFFF